MELNDGIFKNVTFSIQRLPWYPGSVRERDINSGTSAVRRVVWLLRYTRQALSVGVNRLAEDPQCVDIRHEVFRSCIPPLKLWSNAQLSNKNGAKAVLQESSPMINTPISTRGWGVEGVVLCVVSMLALA